VENESDAFCELPGLARFKPKNAGNPRCRVHRGGFMEFTLPFEVPSLALDAASSAEHGIIETKQVIAELKQALVAQAGV